MNSPVFILIILNFGDANYFNKIFFKKYLLVILNTRVNLYVIFLTKYMNCRNKIEILKIVNINEDSIDYEKDELSDIFGSYSKFIEISLNYLRLQQAKINDYLGDKKIQC